MMALDKSKLETALLDDVFNAPTLVASDAADAIAAAYADYAADAMFGTSAPAIAGSVETTMAAAILAVLSVPNPTPAAFVAALVSGVTTFWTGITVNGAQSGTTVAPTGGAAATTALTTLFGVPNDAATAASGTADALDTLTKTTTASVSPPPGTTLNIS